MKRNRRRLPIPQHEFGFTPSTFNLIQDTGLDGDRISREQAEADRARRAAEKPPNPVCSPLKTTNESLPATPSPRWSCHPRRSIHEQPSAFWIRSTVVSRMFNWPASIF